jgi:hypothetical protein
MEGKRNFRPNTLVSNLKPKQPKLRTHHDLPHPHHLSHDLSHRLPVLSSLHASRSAHILVPKSKDEENDEKDEKAVVKLMKSKLPQFSNEADWEISIFELGLVLDRVWPHKDELDIVDYMTSPFHRRSVMEDMETRADCLIYFALTMSAKKDSYAKLQIMASCHRDAVPCVMKNEGRKLYQMFQAMFTMTNLHQASLPYVRAEVYSITQRENELILKYTSRVDVIVATTSSTTCGLKPPAGSDQFLEIWGRCHKLLGMSRIKY